MDGFSDIDSGSEVGSEVSEVESTDNDFGDGDGVNDFDETYESMNNGYETMDYSEGIPEDQDVSENDIENTESAVDEQLDDFDDASELEENQEAAEVSENDQYTPSDFITDENVDEALSDFDDDVTEEGETSESDETIESEDETGEVENEMVESDEAVESGDETGEEGKTVESDETVESENETGEVEDETSESDKTVESEDETGEVEDEMVESDEAVESEDETGEVEDETSESDETIESEDETDEVEDETSESDETIESEDETDEVEDEMVESDEAVESENETGEVEDETSESDKTVESEDETGEVEDETVESDKAVESEDETGEVEDETSESDEVVESEDESSEAEDETSESDEVVESEDESGEAEDEISKSDKTVESKDKNGAALEKQVSDWGSESSELTLYQRIAEYMNEHDYGPADFSTYSQDPEWRNLQREVYPDYELPELSQESARVQLSNYMNEHNYGIDDFTTYSQEPIWQELYSAAYPDYDLSAVTNSNDVGSEVVSSQEGRFENVSYQQGQNDIGALGTCGPTSIANSLNRVTDSSAYTENNVLHNAIDNGLCNKSDNPYACGGTTTSDVVEIIDNVKDPESNIHTEVYEYEKALSVDDLASRLDDPHTVAIVGVDSATLWDQRGDVACSGLFQHIEAPSDHWITVDSPIKDEQGNVTGFNIIDSGGGVSEVSRDRFESMYMGDAGHTVSDPTAILISNTEDGANIYETSEGIEKVSNYKGSAVESDGGDPPTNNEISGKIKNTECDKFGSELSDEAKEVNERFRGDNFDQTNTFEASLDPSEKERIVKKNALTTCGLNENLDGKLDGTKFAAIDKTDILETRANVPEVKSDTVMQKVIPAEQVNNYLNGDWTQVRNCCSKAADTAPYVSCGSEAYKELRLDYNGNDNDGCNVKVLESNADMYIIRFTSDTDSLELSIPNDGHPCTGTGFTGSSEHLIPEYKYPATTPTDGAIYKLDANGNETIVGIWDNDMKRFYPIP